MLLSPASDRQPVLDSQGRSPWVGRASTFDEFRELTLPSFVDPFNVEPDEDLLIPGTNGIDGEETEYRLGKELWLPGRGFLYREALSCKRTTLNARMRAAVQFIQEHLETSAADVVYMTEQVTPLFEFMRGRYPLLQGSEYLPGVPYGSFRDQVRCEDLQALTFDDNSFDLILSFDVLEHVPEYKLAIYEMARVLRPGGHLVMTAPTMAASQSNHVRAIINDEGKLEHELPPEYHGNPLGPPSLCFTSFGFNLIEELRSYGFVDSFAQFYFNMELGYWGGPELLLIATK
jgi:hypothetical protein